MIEIRGTISPPVIEDVGDDVWCVECPVCEDRFTADAGGTATCPSCDFEGTVPPDGGAA